MTDQRPVATSTPQGMVSTPSPIVATANNIRSPGPIPQVQVIPQQMHSPPYGLPNFPYNQQLMLQNAAVQAMAMNQQLNMAAAMQGRPPSVSPTSHTIMSPSVSMAQGGCNVVVSSAGSNQTMTLPKTSSNGKTQTQQQTMVASKPTMMPAQAVSPLVFGNFGVLQGPVSTGQAYVGQSKGQTVTVAHPGQQQLLNSQAPLRLNTQPQLVNAGQIITSQPMLTNQAVLQAMANLQQQGIPLGAHQQLLTSHGQSQAILAGQSLYIRAAGPFQTPQNLMTTNMQNFGVVKTNKVIEVQQAAQVKPNTVLKNTTIAPPGKALLPSVSKTAKIQPTQVIGQTSAQLNIPSVPKTKHRSKSSSAKPSVPSSPNLKTAPVTAITKTTSNPLQTNGKQSSKSQSDSEVEMGKKQQPVAATVKELVKPTDNKTEDSEKEEKSGDVLFNEKEKDLVETCDEKLPPPLEKPVVEKQRAIVKPHILTHVIEGFVIHEGYEPFPVQRSTQMSEFIPPKPCRNDKESEDDMSESFDENPPPLLDAHDALVGNREPPTLKCEFCGKTDLAFKFRCSKRFCSRSCAKRYNVGCSKRMGIYPTNMGGRYIRKRKHVLVKKGWRPGRGGRLTYNIMRMLPNDEENKNNNTPTQVPIDEFSSSNSNQDSSSSPASPVNPQDIDIEMEEPVEPATTTNPARWTVMEVCDFINNLQGCSSIAEEFRSQEIDGQALLLLNEDHLMTAMNIKLGPALKICAKINSLKGFE
ncbi:polyhomeotic-like protein 2 isoform X2 [Patella vulgata]|uniref:polyhomeotic-like protein 2 isoform X2 n=1 Tax=Patella vulgata TaxID=6465 RepID=UPI00218043C6|nr:polyhomeotic-like protein 2 isoform X2 [Patella vulgata]